MTDPVEPSNPQPVAPLKQTTGITKPGWQTSEFWLHVLLIVGVVATSLSTSGLPPQWAAACATAATASYGISRGLAKLFNGN